MSMKKQAVNDPSLIAACGLYCGSCYRYLKGKCPGCRENIKASWCKIRSCVLEHEYANCAGCTHDDYATCKIYNNKLGKFFAFIFRSNRPACIARIKEVGEKQYAEEMAEEGLMTIKR